ncbi:MAG: sigma-54 dependent transcriptional regulator, partial [Planctomycetota bacterium]|nr:sigma-54 dependent transcriptional regulator [Planctomycetota bacterium]
MRFSGTQVLYAEDDSSSASLMKALLSEEGHKIDIASTGADFLFLLDQSLPDLCLLDLNLPDMSGLDLLQTVRQQYPGLPVLMVTASDSLDDAIRAMKLGAVDFITKPFDGRRLLISINHVLDISRQKREIEVLRSDLQDNYSLAHMVGSSSEMEQIRNLIERVASSESTVLVTGESGTGKELVCRALHYSSDRKQKRFLDVNCAALNESLLESELFGHEKGAFTGAEQRRRGQFEQADGGTLYLDEIGDMPMPTQTKILRFLEDRTLTRVGGEEKIRVDVRVVCATNQNLEKAVVEKTFRKDLYYRINTIPIHLSPLRSRVSDIPELTHHFLARACKREKRRIDGVSSSAMEILSGHSWPGNIRELEHAIDRAVLMCEGAEIQEENLPPAVLQNHLPAGDPNNLLEAVERLERELILTAL